MTPTSRASELGKFLRAKRAALGPECVGLSRGSRRRVKGLRRAEVAELAAVSVDWYVALEQGRDVRPSEHVLARLARALALTPVEEDHLYALAGRNPLLRQPRPVTKVSSTILRIIERMEPDPAYVLDPTWDVLASNRAATELWGFQGTSAAYSHNLLWRTFVIAPRPSDPHWLHLTDYFLRSFRRQATTYGGEARIVQLVQDLEQRSERFRELWAQPELRETRGGRKDLVHPSVGLKTYDFAALAIPEIPGAHLFIYLEPHD
ncbi:helix-turn-helix domain-containing protein [Stenotrophomonas maltophilia]|uniref:helix-turn-helix transcriptional regulator n=1 Tax=Stenotrophomonas maltophilia TaxID=40324 RepID=UPI0021C7E3AD|nr:helix-turn-helix transcriptional regulator [Stenotrophomonas maltophilia]MCU1126894.1 helix-turn-helix domain-containing protein [Stenotrophomonas maltophilia]